MIDIGKNKDIVSLAGLPFDLNFIKDIHRYDGQPLTSLCFSPAWDTWIYNWCDCGDKGEAPHRWMLFRSRSLVDYLDGKICFREFVCDLPDGFVYLVDKYNEAGKKKVFYCPASCIPEEYLPREGCYYNEELSV